MNVLTIVDNDFYPGKRKIYKPMNKYWLKKLLEDPDDEYSVKPFDKLVVKDGKKEYSFDFFKVKVKHNPVNGEKQFQIKIYA